MSLPEAFVTRLKEILPAQDFDACFDSFSLPQATGFRINTLLASKEAVLEKLYQQGFSPQPVAWFDQAFTISPKAREAFVQSSVFLEKQVYIQNLSSMIPALLLAPEPTDHVLDLTAAPGSKTHLLACLMKNQGEIAAVELVKNRFFKLKENLAQFGVTNTKTFLRDGSTVWRYRPNTFDKILLDAPCSTEGRFRTDEPQSYQYWQPRKIKEMVRKQKKLLFSAIRCLKPNGTLVYSTCTFAPEENEGIVDWALNKFGNEIEILPLSFPFPNAPAPLTHWQKKSFTPAVKHACRILPSETMEAFFVCKFRKRMMSYE